VPTLVDGDFSLNQSLAIIDYLDHKGSIAPLYPTDFKVRAQVKAFTLDLACEIHPLNNLRVQQYLVKELNVPDADKLTWIHHWMTIGFKAIELKLTQTAGNYCFANKVTVADICLVSQVYNAVRFNVDMSVYPIIMRVVNYCNQQPAFIKALPENQADAI